MYISEIHLEEMFQMNSTEGFYEFYPKEEYQKIFHGINHLYSEGKYRLLAKQLGVLFEPTLNYLVDYGKARRPLLKQLVKSETSDEILAHFAVAMILDSYEEGRLVVHGDAEVIENLNYFEFHELDDRENVRAYYEFVESDIDNSTIGQLHNELKNTPEEKQPNVLNLLDTLDDTLDKFIEHIYEQANLPNYLQYIGRLIDTFKEFKQAQNGTRSLKAFDDVLYELAELIENAGKLNIYYNMLSNVADASFDITLDQNEKLWSIIETTLWQWADKFNIPHDVLPRDRDSLLELTELEIISQGIITPLNDVSELVEVLEEETEAFYLPVELFELTELTKLEVFGMSLTYLPDEIEKLEKLTELKLTMNQLEMIPSSVGNLKNLTTLDLSINWLEEIPITLAKLKNLKYLNVGSEKLTITSSQEDWLYELADDGCEVIWDRDNTTVIGSEDEYDEEQSTRDFIESLGGEEALIGALKSMNTKED